MHDLTCVRWERPQMAFGLYISPHESFVLMAAPLATGSTTAGTLFRNGCSEAGIDTGLLDI
jgi:hypothetical protein